MLSCWIPVAWIPVWNRLTSRCPQILHNHTCNFQNLQHPFAHSKGWSHLRPQILLLLIHILVKIEVLRWGMLDCWHSTLIGAWLLTKHLDCHRKIAWILVLFLWYAAIDCPLFYFQKHSFFVPRTAIPIQVWPVILLSGGSVTRSKTSSKLVSMILTWILQNSWTTFFICIKCCFYNSLQTILKLRSF